VSMCPVWLSVFDMSLDKSNACMRLHAMMA